MSLHPAATTRPGDLAAIGRRATRVREGQVSRGRSAEPLPKTPMRINLWLPVTPIFWILAPFSILMSPLILLAPPLWRMDPYVTALAVGRVLIALGGTHVEVDAPDARVHIHLL